MAAEAQQQPWAETDTAAARAAIPHLRPSLAHLNSAGCSIPSATTLAAVQDYIARCAAVGCMLLPQAMQPAVQNDSRFSAAATDR